MNFKNGILTIHKKALLSEFIKCTNLLRKKNIIYNIEFL
jgi:hypothetical protein